MCANFRAEDCMNISARSLQDFITTVHHPPSLLQCWQRVCSPRWGGGRGLGVIIAGLVRLRRDQGWFRGRLGRSVTELHKMQQLSDRKLRFSSIQHKEGVNQCLCLSLSILNMKFGFHFYFLQTRPLPRSSTGEACRQTTSNWETTSTLSVR